MVDKELKLKIKPVKKISNDYQTQGALFYFEKNPQKNKNINQIKKENKIDYNEIKEILNNKININKSHKIIKNNNILANTFLNSFEINITNKKRVSSLINNNNK